MNYAKPCADACTELEAIRAAVAVAGIEVVAARSEEGVLTISTDQDIPGELASELGLS